MPDIKTEQYEKAVKRAIDRWAKKLEEPLKKIEKLEAEIKRLEDKKPLSPEEEELQLKCIKAREKLQKEVEKAALELKVDLMLIEPPPEAAKGDFEKLADELKKYIKKVEKGLPLGGGFSLKPDIEFDFKKRSLKKAMVILEWKF